ncbi:hypothetical protein E0H89_01675 [Acinetobacter sp. ANC 3781]|nr:hypothetical protein E0H89_01675 [Acinetobacter sp. ANC 3781]
MACEMNIEDYSAQPSFPFTFKPSEFSDYYQD